MENKSRLSFGPGAASIILILVILSMSVLAVLSLISSKEEMKLADRSVEVIEAVCALNTKAEEMVSEIDGVVAAARGSGQTEEEVLRSIGEQLPEGVQLSENTVSWTETDGKRQLSCIMEITGSSGSDRLKWVEHRLTAITEDPWN
jgi:hypothetical protein